MNLEEPVQEFMSKDSRDMAMARDALAYSQAVSLERIADALERIADGQTTVLTETNAQLDLAHRPWLGEPLGDNGHD